MNGFICQMLTPQVVILAALLTLARCQRGSFAGTRPIGFPELLNKTTTTVDPLGNRFGEGDSTTERLPLEANGDRDLVNRISKWPIENQPFWYLNWKALEEHRKNPQTYPQRPSHFAQTLNLNVPNRKTGTLDSRFGTQNSGTPNSNTGILNSNIGTQNSSNRTLNAAQNSTTPSFENRHGGIATNSDTGHRRQVNTGYHNRYGT